MLPPESPASASPPIAASASSKCASPGFTLGGSPGELSRDGSGPRRAAPFKCALARGWSTPDLLQLDTVPALSRSGALPGRIITVNPWPRRAVRATVRRLLLLATEARRRWCRSRMAGGVRRVGHGWPTPPLPAMDGWRRGGALPPPAGSCGAPSGSALAQAKSCVRSDSSSIRHSPSGRSPSDRPPTWLRCRAATWLPTAANMRRTWW